MIRPSRNRALWGEIADEPTARKKAKRKLIILPQKKVNTFGTCKPIKSESESKQEYEIATLRSPHSTGELIPTIISSTE